MTWSSMSCPEALQVWPQSEETSLERDFVIKLFILIKKMYDLINSYLFIKLISPLQVLYEPYFDKSWGNIMHFML